MAAKTLVQRAEVTITNADGGNFKDFVIPSAVKLGSTFIVSSVMENRAGNARGATVRLEDATHVRVSWPGALAGGESITVSYEVYDLDDVADDLLEILFRMERMLGYLGENTLQDDIEVDDAGNIVSYRIRLFDTEAHAAAATVDIEGNFPQLGERARIEVSQDVDFDTNDRVSLLRLRTELITTPGVS